MGRGPKERAMSTAVRTGSSLMQVWCAQGIEEGSCWGTRCLSEGRTRKLSVLTSVLALWLVCTHPRVVQSRIVARAQGVHAGSTNKLTMLCAPWALCTLTPHSQHGTTLPPLHTKKHGMNGDMQRGMQDTISLASSCSVNAQWRRWINPIDPLDAHG